MIDIDIEQYKFPNLMLWKRNVTNVNTKQYHKVIKPTFLNRIIIRKILKYHGNQRNSSTVIRSGDCRNIDRKEPTRLYKELVRNDWLVNM